MNNNAEVNPEFVEWLIRYGVDTSGMVFGYASSCAVSTPEPGRYLVCHLRLIEEPDGTCRWGGAAIWVHADTPPPPIMILATRSNLYFVIDRHGDTGETIPGMES